jgi:hypothetical protein
MARINIFTTEHPLTTQSSWFNVREHPFLSFVSATFVLALSLTPLVLWRLCLYAMSDIGADNPFADNWLTLVTVPIVAFAISLLCAAPIVLLYRLVARLWKSRKASSGPQVSGRL